MAPSRSQGRLHWDAECDSASVGAAGCAALLRALDRASAALESAVALRADLSVKLSAAGGVKLKRFARGNFDYTLGEADIVAGCAVPVYLPMPPRAGAPPDHTLYPQALARQLANYKKNELGRWDAVVSVSVPEDGFFFEEGTPPPPDSPDARKINFDAVILHELLHGLGVSTSLGNNVPGRMLTTEPVLNGTSFSFFSPLHAFDSHLVDAQDRPLSALWTPAASFLPRMSDWQSEFRASPASVGAGVLYELATTPGAVRFLASDGRAFMLDTSPMMYARGRTLAHLDPGNSSPDDVLLFPSAPRGPLPDALFARTEAGRVLALPPAASAILKTLGWTMCEDVPGGCAVRVTAPAAASRAAQVGSTGGKGGGMPVWAIAATAVGAVLLVAGLVVGGVFLIRSRKRTQGGYRDLDREGLLASTAMDGGARSKPPSMSESAFLSRPKVPIPAPAQRSESRASMASVASRPPPARHTRDHAAVAGLLIGAPALQGRPGVPAWGTSGPPEWGK